MQLRTGGQDESGEVESEMAREDSRTGDDPRPLWCLVWTEFSIYPTRPFRRTPFSTDSCPNSHLLRPGTFVVVSPNLPGRRPPRHSYLG